MVIGMRVFCDEFFLSWCICVCLDVSRERHVLATFFEPDNVMVPPGDSTWPDPTWPRSTCPGAFKVLRNSRRLDWAFRRSDFELLFSSSRRRANVSSPFPPSLVLYKGWWIRTKPSVLRLNAGSSPIWVSGLVKISLGLEFFVRFSWWSTGLFLKTQFSVSLSLFGFEVVLHLGVVTLRC
jgi:hypothetical protein